jgi:hypothetical protein
MIWTFSFILLLAMKQIQMMISPESKISDHLDDERDMRCKPDKNSY